MTIVLPPERTEAAEYFFRYIDQVPEGDILAILRNQTTETLALLRGIPDDKSQHRYAPDKWSIRQVVTHINDCERLFVGRAFWFARVLEGELPSFDQDVAMVLTGADERSWNSHIDEFVAVRSATQTLFDNLPTDAWSRCGVAGGNPFSVRALAYISAGHVTHHLKILRERYL